MLVTIKVYSLTVGEVSISLVPEKWETEPLFKILRWVITQKSRR
jgi:hypothetical protein